MPAPFFLFRTTNGDFPPARAVRGSRSKRAEAQERAFPCQNGGERGKEVACAGQAATRRLPKRPSFVSRATVLSSTAAQAVGGKSAPGQVLRGMRLPCGDGRDVLSPPGQQAQ